MKIELDFDLENKTIKGNALINDKKLGVIVNTTGGIPLTLYTELLVTAIFRKAINDGLMPEEEVYPNSLVAKEII